MEKKYERLYQGLIDHNSHHNQNILRAKGDRQEATEGIPRCYGYHEACRWNSRWCPCQGLCSLQKMGGTTTKIYGPLTGNKITQRQMQIYFKECAAAARPSLTHFYDVVLFNC